MSNVFKYENVIWSLPMLFQYEALYSVIKTSVEREVCAELPTAYLYGSPACAWTGGRPPTVYQPLSRDTLTKILKYVCDLNAVPTFTFSCTSITDSDLNDRYANLILDVGIECGARFIVYSDKLRDYIKSKSPDSTVVASVIKPALHFQGPDRVEAPEPEVEAAFYNKLLDEYDIVVVRPEFSKGALQENPSLIKDLSRIEVLINQTCICNCPKMPEHYRFLESLRQSMKPMGEKFSCVRVNMSPQDNYNNHLLHTPEEISRLVDAGVQHLKLQGRSDNFSACAFAFLMGNYMFKMEGQNYRLATALAREEVFAEEFNKFNVEVLGQQPPQQQQRYM